MSYDVKQDLYQSGQSSITFARKGVAISPSDTVDLAPYSKGVVVTSIAGGANVVILPAKNADGTTVTFTGVTVGQILPYFVRRVMDTGTSATVASLFD